MDRGCQVRATEGMGVILVTLVSLMILMMMMVSLNMMVL
jgi:hypothetical protein